MITGGQIRAARAFLRWSGEELAEKSGVSHQAIHRAEQVDGVPSMLVGNIIAIERALEAAGVIFVDENGEGPGVRLKKSL